MHRDICSLCEICDTRSVYLLLFLEFQSTIMTIIDSLLEVAYSCSNSKYAYRTQGFGIPCIPWKWSLPLFPNDMNMKHGFTGLKGAERALGGWKASELGSVHPSFFRQMWKGPWNENGCVHAWLPRWNTDNIGQSLVRISEGDFLHKRATDTRWHLSVNGNVLATFHFLEQPGKAKPFTQSQIQKHWPLLNGYRQPATPVPIITANHFTLDPSNCFLSVLVADTVKRYGMKCSIDPQTKQH